MVLRGKPTPTRFPTNIFYTAPLHSIPGMNYYLGMVVNIGIPSEKY